MKGKSLVKAINGVGARPNDRSNKPPKQVVKKPKKQY